MVAGAVSAVGARCVSCHTASTVTPEKTSIFVWDVFGRRRKKGQGKQKKGGEERGGAIREREMDGLL